MRPPPPSSTPFPYTTLFRSRSRGFCFVVILVSETVCVSRAISATNRAGSGTGEIPNDRAMATVPPGIGTSSVNGPRSEEHTSELQSHHDLVCRLLLEKKKQI